MLLKNGFSKGGKKKYQCRKGERQFVLNRKNQIIEEKKERVDKPLLEKSH